MRKTFVVAAMLAASPLAFAGNNNVGCGVGTIIFDHQSGVAPQVLAVTTNGTFGNQTFGISSGTLGCSRDGVVANPVRVSMFVGSNMDQLARNMSAGHGQSLNALADLIGIKNHEKVAFFQLTQRHFAQIVPTAHITAKQMVTNLSAVMSSTPEFAPYARNV
ncbi:MAG: DUF3015 family protein [Acidiferrobacteraceae bacterium]|jgi:hypothetical protein